MSRPISWIERSEKARRIWEDPLGFALVHGGEARLPATTDPGRVLILGGHSFREVPGEEGTLFYALEDADRPLAWRFDWAAGWTRAQAALQARRLLSTLVLDRDPPAR